MKHKIPYSPQTFKVGTKLGIIGGGQLAQMLALAGLEMGLEIHILSEKNSDPAALVTRFWHEGMPHSEKDQTDFCKKVDLITFESEFYSMAHFIELESKVNFRFFPAPTIMQKLQHRYTQKNLLVEFKIPTAEFYHVQNNEDLLNVAKYYQNKFVLKKSSGGYDGNGTLYCKSTADLEKMKSLFPGDFIAESLISFQRELALILIRSADGSCIHLPLVETQQTQSRCDWVVGPIQHPKINPLIKKLQLLLKKQNYVGAIGVELFDTGKDLIVNELAPRVHNSGHYSQDALSISQFQLHIMAILGVKLQAPNLLAKAFVMTNLLGQGNTDLQFPKNITGKLHWYGKKENRAGRKLGHVNYLGITKEKILKLALKERKGFQI